MPEKIKAIEAHIQGIERALHDLGKRTGKSLRLGLRPSDGTLLVFDTDLAAPVHEIPTDCGMWWSTPSPT